MAVTIWLTIGEKRVLETAGGAAIEGYFVRITAPDRRAGSERRTVLMLRAVDVVRVEIDHDGVTSEIVPGHASEE